MSQQATQSIKFSSRIALKPVLIGFRLMGSYTPKKFKWLYWTYAIILTIVVTFYYPLSLLINVFLLDSSKIILANLSIFFENVMCCLKVVNAFLKRRKIFTLLKLLPELDARVIGDDEKEYFQFILKMAHYFIMAFAISFGLGGGVDDLPVLFAKERRLLYPAWFPWNWKDSAVLYHITHTYQVVGIYIQIIMVATCDLYPALFYWLLKGHLRVLGMRIEKIGFDLSKSSDNNYAELKQCIKDHKICLSYFNLCQNITSRILFLQFISKQCVLCMTAVYLLFHNDDLFEGIYLKFYLVAVLMEISLCCYCGSALTEESENLTWALYSCNWMEQDIRFKKVLIVFMQQTQKSWTIQAGGIISVSLGTWLSILKSSYSLFVVLSQIV